MIPNLFGLLRAPNRAGTECAGAQSCRAQSCAPNRARPIVRAQSCAPNRARPIVPRPIVRAQSCAPNRARPIVPRPICSRHGQYGTESAILGRSDRVRLCNEFPTLLVVCICVSVVIVLLLLAVVVFILYRRRRENNRIIFLLAGSGYQQESDSDKLSVTVSTSYRQDASSRDNGWRNIVKQNPVNSANYAISTKAASPASAAGGQNKAGKR
uniref:Uncharacterized protein n=1 Tax=Globodera rostochiensis TaxID=31243 RepID=A0A914IC80_GLORO